MVVRFSTGLHARVTAMVDVFNAPVGMLAANLMINGQPYTLNSNPQISNPKPQTPTPNPQTRKLQTPSPKL